MLDIGPHFESRGGIAIVYPWHKHLKMSEKLLRDMVRAVGALAVLDPLEDLRPSPFSEVMVRVPVKPGRVGESDQTTITSYGLLPASTWELLRAVIRNFGPLYSAIELEDDVWSIEGSGNYVMMLASGDEPETGHEKLEAASLLREAFLGAGMLPDEISYLLGDRSNDRLGRAA